MDVSGKRKLKFRCPYTNNEVESSIQTDDTTLVRMRAMTISVWCPHCATSHQMKADEAYVDFKRVWRAA